MNELTDAERSFGAEVASRRSGIRQRTYAGAIFEAITEAMDADPSVIVLGDSVADPEGTRGSTGLVERFGKSRVIATPLSEDGITGACIGLALAGMRPLQVHIRADFGLLAMNQLVNIAAKWRYMFGGASGGVPLTVRLTIGRSWGQGAQHSQGLQSLFAHIPGLRVVMPSTPWDAKGAMAWALRASKDPVVFVDHRMLHGTTGEVDEDISGACGPSYWRQPVGHGETADITIVALSYMVVEATRAAEHLRLHGISAAVFDPLWIRPLPMMKAVGEDAQRTRRLLVVDCGWPTYGFSSEVLAGVMERGNGLQQVARMGFAETACPTAKSLENLYYPTAETIAAKAFEMVKGHVMPKWEENTAATEAKEFRGPF